MTIDCNDATAAELYRILSTAVAPRPICFASTINAAGQVNLSPYSFFNVVSINPPILGFSVTRRGADNSTKDTLNNVREVPQVVINVVEHRYVEQMSLTSTQFEPGVNEFEKAALTQVPSEIIKPPRVGEAAISFECTVDQVIAFGEEPISGNLVLARVRRIHLSEGILTEQGKVDSELLDLVGRMGGNYYVRATDDAKFIVAKPGTVIGIGVDGLPDWVRNDLGLDGNELGRLGGVEALPAPEAARQTAAAHLNGAQEEPLTIARRLIADNDSATALAVLLASRS